MPELPEVEVVRRGLESHVTGRRVTAVEVLHPRPLRRQEGGPEAFSAGLTGRRLVAAVRRGKLMWMPLDNGQALAAHLGMSGQLLVRGTRTSPGGTASGRQAPEEGPVEEPGGRVSSFLGDPARGHSDLTALAVPSPVRDVSARPRHLRVRLHLGPTSPAGHSTAADEPPPATGAGGGLACLDLVDQRMLGGLHLVDLVPTPDGMPGGTGSAQPLMPADATHVARDLLDPHLDRSRVVERVRASRRAVKTILLDQAVVSGIGSIYADEGLWESRVHGARPGSSLAARTVTRLLEATEKVMHQALAAGGTSFDALYVDVDGAPGYFARELGAYGRAGQECHRCRATMRTTRAGGRSHVFCPRCQRPGPGQESRRRGPQPRSGATERW